MSVLPVHTILTGHNANRCDNNRRGEELPRAYIVPQENTTADPKEIANWLSSRVAPHKRLAGGVAITDTIPKNPSGKILRKLLRERAKEEVGDGAPKRSRL